MTSHETLLQMIAEHSVSFGDFTLSSGRQSDHLIDLKQVMLTSEGLGLIGEALYERLRGHNIQAVGGPAVGAIPLMSAALTAFDSHGETMFGFYVRELRKDHGTSRLVEGCLEGRLVILEDVATTGGSILKAVAACREQGATVDQALVIVDREEGARELLAEHGVSLNCLFTWTEVRREYTGPSQR